MRPLQLNKRQIETDKEKKMDLRTLANDFFYILPLPLGFFSLCKEGVEMAQ
jgi:hypothetical protein